MDRALLVLQPLCDDERWLQIDHEPRPFEERRPHDGRCFAGTLPTRHRAVDFHPRACSHRLQFRRPYASHIARTGFQSVCVPRRWSFAIPVRGNVAWMMCRAVCRESARAVPSAQFRGKGTAVVPAYPGAAYVAGRGVERATELGQDRPPARAALSRRVPGRGADFVDDRFIAEDLANRERQDPRDPKAGHPLCGDNRTIAWAEPEGMASGHGGESK